MNKNTQSSWSPEINPIQPTQHLDQQDQYKAWFIGEKFQNYYKKHFDQITLKKGMSGFNIAAFFLGAVWLFYRKMYAYGLFYIAFMLLSSVMSIMLDLSESVDRGISIGIAVGMGMSGNGLYKYFVEKKIKYLNQTTEPSNIENILKQQGGTNIWLALAILLISVSLFSLGVYLEMKGY